MAGHGPAADRVSVSATASRRRELMDWLSGHDGSHGFCSKIADECANFSDSVSIAAASPGQGTCQHRTGAKRHTLARKSQTEQSSHCPAPRPGRNGRHKVTTSDGAARPQPPSLVTTIKQFPPGPYPRYPPATGLKPPPPAVVLDGCNTKRREERPLEVAAVAA